MSFLKAWQGKPLPSRWCNLEICLWHLLWRTDKSVHPLNRFWLESKPMFPYTGGLSSVLNSLSSHFPTNQNLYLPSKDWKQSLQVDQLIDHKHVNPEGHPTTFAFMQENTSKIQKSLLWSPSTAIIARGTIKLITTTTLGACVEDLLSECKAQSHEHNMKQVQSNQTCYD